MRCVANQNYRLRSWFFGCLALCVFAGAMTVSDAVGAEPGAVLQAQIETGEFGPAINAAAQLPADQRDAALQTIAAAQSRVGANRAAIATVGEMRSDRLRGQVLAQMYAPAAEPGPYGNGRPAGAQGGGVEPDFQSLIDLMTATIAPDTWRDAGGTQGAVESNTGGVFVDPAGAMRPIINGDDLARLGAMRRDAARVGNTYTARQSSALRKVSLTRLERELQLRRAEGRPIDEDLRTLAGLQKIQYVFVYPETGDVVIAGPAGDWYLGRENRLLAVETDRPVLRLDDFVNLLRREFSVGGRFLCSIDPTADGLERVSAFVAESNKKPLAPGARGKWMQDLARSMGPQNITIEGIDPRSRAAHTLVEADYRMKLVGIGREEGTADVPSYLEMVAADKGASQANLDLLRWWFTVNYDALLTSNEHDVYELRGQGVKLLSENEFLAARGQRVASGQSNSHNQEFADRFTKNFAAMSQKYPIYAELQNLFDIALVCAVLKHDGVCDRIDWHRSGFMDPNVFALEQGPAPTTVDTVVNSRELTKSLIIASVSGGVTADFTSLAQPSSMTTDDRGQLLKVRRSAGPGQLPSRAWWWD